MELLTQTPTPLQSCPLIVLPAQSAAPHAVVALYKRQAPWPSQVPSLLQVLGLSVAHSLSGSTPAAMLPQSPSAPPPFFAAEHAWQIPAQSWLQHTPSAQLPSVHWDGDVQAAPVASRGTHWPWGLQKLPVVQSALTAQGFRQTPPPQV